MQSIIIGHQGWADFFTQNGIYNYYINSSENLKILVIDEFRQKMVSKIFNDRKNVEVIVPKILDSSSNGFNKNIGTETCVICHTNLGGLICPREPANSCKYVDYDSYFNFNKIKLNAFNNYGNWDTFLHNRNLSFAHCMYEYEKFDPNLRIKNFHINRDEELEDEKYRELEGKEYFLVHDDSTRNFEIPENLFNKNIHRINLNMKSEIMIDMLKIIENAKELHFIDSSYSVLIYLLSFSNPKIRSIPKYLYTLNRESRDTGIYSLPNAENWHLIK
jgi:hypothetical protein